MKISTRINRTGRMAGFRKLTIPTAKKQTTQIPTGNSIVGGNMIKSPKISKPGYSKFPKGLVT
jgi:hypothetical protein